MKKKFIALFLFVFGFGYSYAQPKASLLYQITGKDLSKPSYLFGTYHLIGKDFIDTLPGILKTFNQAQVVVGEIATEDPVLMAQKMMPFMMAKDSTLDKVLSPGEFKKLDDYIHRKTGAGASAYNMFKPAMVQTTLLVMTAPKTISDTNPPLDFYFQELAGKQNKKIVGLETLEEQAKLLFARPIEKQKKDLLKYISDSTKNDGQSEELFNSYKNQDIAQLEKLLADDDEISPEDRAQLISDRNENWMKKIPALIASQSVFIAVGAGHLFGEGGLLELLKQHGYQVVPISTR